MSYNLTDLQYIVNVVFIYSIVCRKCCEEPANGSFSTVFHKVRGLISWNFYGKAIHKTQGTNAKMTTMWN